MTRSSERARERRTSARASSEIGWGSATPSGDRGTSQLTACRTEYGERVAAGTENHMRPVARRFEALDSEETRALGAAENGAHAR